MRKGDLAETPYAVLLHALAVHRRTCVLEIQRSQLKKRIVLETGMPVDCHSNLLHETLGKFMVSRGTITEEQCQLIRSRAITAGQSFAEILVSQGTVPASELYRILQQNLAKKLLDGFTWLDGEFNIISDMPAVESPLKVKTPQLIITGITKLVPDEEIEKALVPLVEKKLFVNPSPPYLHDDIRFTGEHQLIIEVLSGGRYVDQLEKDTQKPRERVLRLLYSLVVIGWIVPEDWLPQERLVASPDMDFMLPMPEPLQSAESELTLAHPEEVRDEVMNLYLRYRKLDAFELLGLSDDSSEPIIQKKYLEFSEKYAPWKFKQLEFDDLAEKAKELFIAGGKAFGELSDPERRHSIIVRRQDLASNRTVELNRDQLLAKTDLLDSETQFKTGKELMEAKNYEGALEPLQSAHDYDPQNAVYRAELAYCRYMSGPDLHAEKALQELNEALRIDPECGLASYYAGVLHSDRGNFIEAEAYLQNAVKMIGTDDRRPIDALKALEAAKDQQL
jgi:hypothetical protein